MEQTWRWFGSADPVTLSDARQAGAEGIVTALHEIPAGAIWPLESICRRQKEVAHAGLRWSVVESLDVTERIKARSTGWQQDVENFCQSLRNLGQCGIRTVAYNLMPVFSWMRTDLRRQLPHGGFTIAFDAAAFAAFDLHILQRAGAEVDWSEEQRASASRYYRQLSAMQLDALQNTILRGLPGGNGSYTMKQVQALLDTYREIDKEAFRANTAEFLRAVVPVAQEEGIRLCVHPDDPPRPLFGLPRIVSTMDDLAWLMEQSPLEANGITFCTGALGVRADNNLLEMVTRFVSRIGFAHLRSTQRLPPNSDGATTPIESFFEAAHLEGDADLVGIIVELVKEDRRRRAAGLTHALPFRADHGQELFNDVERNALPGYPAVGRLRGLAELRGAIRMAERLLPQIG